MSLQMNVAIWLAVNVQQKIGCVSSIGELHEKCKTLRPQPTRDVVAKMIKALFNVESFIHYQGGEKQIVYNNLTINKNISLSNSGVLLPSFCNISVQTDCRYQFQCPVNYFVNGNQLMGTVSFTDMTTMIKIAKQIMVLEYALPICQDVIDGIVLALQTLRLCNGVPADGKLPKTFQVENVSFLDQTSVSKIGRSARCKMILPFLGKTDTCTTCNDSFTQFRKRSRSSENSICTEHSQLRVFESATNGDQPAKRALRDITSEINTQLEDSSDTAINLSSESHSDMDTILNNIILDGSAGQFKLLLESQLRNNKRDIDARQRRWDPKVISICLGILLRSPQAYQTLKDSQLFTLPSRRTLQYYKNVIKQKPGFNAENIDWMKRQAVAENIPAFGLHGGLLIDEMTIQDDLVISKDGDNWNIIGLIDMGETNNNIKVITGGKKKVEMATHALQYVFHGFTGFRWPVVYFGSSTATAHELYTTFWECVDQLDEVGFTIDYVMLDGASTNRSFMKMMMETPRSMNYMFPNVFDKKHSICAIQDIMHVLKKLRNNLESSCSDNRSKAGRYLVLNEVPVLWEHWIECWRFNFQHGFSIHRKLTEEHFSLTPASKMRNHLAIQVLDKDMLFLMKSYQSTLNHPDRLSSSVALLEHTAQLTSIFCDHNRPISNMSDERLKILGKILTFFNAWEAQVLESTSFTVKKNLMTEETRDDLNSAVSGFRSLCSIHVKGGNSINPGYLNSDLIENFFCQQRGIRNGLNTNPTLAQYGPSKTAIILGQHSISSKANSGTSTSMYAALKPCPLNPQRNKAQVIKRRSIRI